MSNETAGTTENTNNGGQTSNNNNQGGNTPAPTPAPAPTPQPSTPAPAPTPSAPSQSVDGGSVVSRAYSKLGCAYSWGGIGPNSFDCSGFVAIALLVAIAAWAPRAPLWAGRVCPIRSPVTL